MYIVPGKNFKNDGNQKIILADKANFSFGFELILAILRRFLPLCNVFSPITPATSCQDADFFSRYDVYTIPQKCFYCFQILIC